MISEQGINPTDRRCTSSPASPLDSDDLLCEIIRLLPPQPSSLLRASLVCRQWRRIVSDADFLRCFRAHHRKPPLLGVFRQLGGKAVFSPTLQPPNRVPSKRFSLRFDCGKSDAWTLLGCRHGRVLAINWTESEVVVADPITGDQHAAALPPEFNVTGEWISRITGGLLGDRSSSFEVVLVRTCFQGEDGEHRAVAHVYSCETGLWGNLISTVEPCYHGIATSQCTLVGNALYWCLEQYCPDILEFGACDHTLAKLRKPDSRCSHIVRTDGGGVGIAMLSYTTFKLWHRKVDSQDVSDWVLHKSVDVRALLGLEPEPHYYCRDKGTIMGYAEDDDAVFVSVHPGIFMVRLKSMQSSRILHKGHLTRRLHPFTSFYTAAVEASSAENDQ